MAAVGAKRSAFKPNVTISVSGVECRISCLPMERGQMKQTDAVSIDLACKCVQRTMEANRTLGIFGQKVWTLLAYVSFTFSSLIGTIIVGLALKFGTWLDVSCKNDIPCEVLTWICMSLKQTLHQIRSTCLDSCLERRPRTSS